MVITKSVGGARGGRGAGRAQRRKYGGGFLVLMG